MSVRHRLVAATAVATLVMAHASAVVLYVDLNSPNPQSPYADWPTAATNIQDAVDAANNGDLVLVTNGLYQTGGRVVYGWLTNRVAVTKSLELRSVNGPNVTTIYGNNQGNFPVNWVRCVYLTNGTVLSGFTLTNGGTAIFSPPREDDGAGVWSESTSAVISNCVISGNAAFGSGGGAYSGSLTYCTLTGNSAAGGGGAASALLTNCTLLDNSARETGGGAQSCTVSGCVLSNNFASVGGAASGGVLRDCTIIANGATNTSYYPQRLGGGVYQATLNNCSLIGNTAGQGGGAADSTLIGCSLRANTAASFGGGASGGSLEDCTIIGNGATNAWPNPQGQGGGVSWATLNNCSVISNTAGQGGGTFNSSLTNCALSANRAFSFGGGSWNSFLQSCTLSTNVAPSGGGVAGGTLIGCTLLGNSAHNNYGSYDISDGGGAYGCPPGADCNFPKCALINCMLVGNESASHDGTGRGGGTSGCWLTNCVLSGNVASDGGGAIGSALVGCTLISNGHGWGGGAYGSGLNSCTVVSNSGYLGGGVYSSSLVNSTLLANGAYQGGGAALSRLNNCTVIGNSAAYGGGVFGGTVNNCIVYSNNASDEGPNYLQTGFPLDTLALNFCCTTPLPTNGFGNITNDPALIDRASGKYHLRRNSPCINSGNNSYVTASTDFDGNPRLAGGTVDIGAYEFQHPTSTISYAWLQQYDLSTDGTADLADTDYDGMNNWQEWICGTNPTNALSVLKMLSPSNSVSGLTVSWQSVTGKTYYLQRCSNLLEPFYSTQSNLVGQAGTTSFLDTAATNTGRYFYRLGVQ